MPEEIEEIEEVEEIEETPPYTPEILFKSNKNFYKLKDGKFYSYGKGEKRIYSIGSWFNCSEEEVKRLRVIILSNTYEICKRIPGTSKVYVYR
jgi:hypothetical protein